MAKASARTARVVRHERVRTKVKGTTARPRLCVFRSSEHIYAQIVDDSIGNTLVAASTLDADVKIALSETKTKVDKATVVGEHVAKRALAKGIKSVVFDRGGNKYHGRVKALADGARAAGLEF